MAKAGRVKDNVSKRTRRRNKKERVAFRQFQKSVEQQVRVAYSKVPIDAAALSQARLRVREWLVIQGFLTVEELEELARDAAIKTAAQRVTTLMHSEQPG